MIGHARLPPILPVRHRCVRGYGVLTLSSDSSTETWNIQSGRLPSIIRRAGLRCARLRLVERERVLAASPPSGFRPEDAPPTVHISSLTGTAGRYREISNLEHNFASSEIANTAPEKKRQLNFHSRLHTVALRPQPCLGICRMCRILAPSKSSPYTLPGISMRTWTTSRRYTVGRSIGRHQYTINKV